MIKVLNKIDKAKILELSKTFPLVFDKFNILIDFNNNPYTRYLYYELNDEIVGFINYNLIYDKVEIVNINVLEKYQNQKIGFILLEELINREKNIDNITLEVREDNNIAIKLYTKCGFKKIGVRNNYYNGVNAVLMERKY